MSLSKLQGHYVIRLSSESEKTELVFSAIHSTNIIRNTARKGYTAYKFVNALEGTAYHKTEKWRNVRLLA
jgi:type IV secretory pathway component VirB8